MIDLETIRKIPGITESIRNEIYSVTYVDLKRRSIGVMSHIIGYSTSFNVTNEVFTICGKKYMCVGIEIDDQFQDLCGHVASYIMLDEINPEMIYLVWMPLF